MTVVEGRWVKKSLTGRIEGQTIGTSAMVWRLGGNGLEAHGSLLSPAFSGSRTQPPPPPFLFLPHSVTHSGWCTPLFFSTWSSGEGQRDTQKQIEMLQWVLSWHDARLMRRSQALLEHTAPKAVTMTPFEGSHCHHLLCISPVPLSTRERSLKQPPGFFQISTFSFGGKTKKAYDQSSSGIRKWLAGGVIPFSVVGCHVTLLQNWFPLSAFYQNINSWT